MKRANVIRWVLTALMLLAMCLCVASPALADVVPLPLDQMVPGNPAREDGWLSEDEYQDESIHVTVEHQDVKLKGMPKKVNCSIVRIKIVDPSQIRTCMSEDSYDKNAYVKAATLAKHVNAIAAVNGDFFKYYDYGYLIRQGVTYREEFSTKHPRDILVIDDQGDFYGVHVGSAEKMADFAANVLPEGRQMINTFSLGPILVEDGVVQEIGKENTGGDFQYRYPMQRVGVVQLGELEYAIVECNGNANASAGMTIQTFAEYIQSLFPDCRLAYNLDGGGSTNVIVNGKRIHKNPDARNICDILYFASCAE